MSSSKSSNQLVVPSAREAGSVGCQMVKKMHPERRMNFKRADRTVVRHEVEVKYIATITV